MSNRVAVYLDELEGTVPSDLIIEMIRKRDQALKEIAETNWQPQYRQENNGRG